MKVNLFSNAKIFFQCNFLKMHILIEKGLTKTISQLLKLIINRDIATHYTAVKAIPGKEVFKNTAFFICMRGMYCIYVVYIFVL